MSKERTSSESVTTEGGVSKLIYIMYCRGKKTGGASDAHSIFILQICLSALLDYYSEGDCKGLGEDHGPNIFINRKIMTTKILHELICTCVFYLMCSDFHKLIALYILLFINYPSEVLLRKILKSCEKICCLNAFINNEIMTMNIIHEPIWTLILH